MFYFENLDELHTASDHFIHWLCLQRDLDDYRFKVFLFNLSACGLSQKKLTTLDIAANRIKKIENINHLTELQEFWVSVLFQADKDGKCDRFSHSDGVSEDSNRSLFQGNKFLWFSSFSYSRVNTLFVWLKILGLWFTGLSYKIKFHWGSWFQGTKELRFPS